MKKNCKSHNFKTKENKKNAITNKNLTSGQNVCNLLSHNFISNYFIKVHFSAVNTCHMLVEINFFIYGKHLILLRKD